MQKGQEIDLAVRMPSTVSVVMEMKVLSLAVVVDDEGEREEAKSAWRKVPPLLLSRDRDS
jgi:hypothetical protein